MDNETSLPPIVADELRLLASARDALAARDAEIPPDVDEMKAELARIRDQIQAAKAEDQGAMMQQYELLGRLLEQAGASANRRKVQADRPYFGHLRLRRYQDGHETDILIGSGTYIDRGVRIVDWRNAPISRIFYTCEEGDDYELPVGERVLEGEVRARRAVRIHGGRLLNVQAPGRRYVRAREEWREESLEAIKLAGGAGAAMEVYGSEQAAQRSLGTDHTGRRRQDKHLPDIAALIDPDQFRLIARPESGLVVVRGVAGSGKTTVALHRVAWLAFQKPEVFRPDRCLVIVWGRALRDYIGHVLPALGVEGVQVKTFGAWAAAQRRRLFPKLPQRPNVGTPADASRLKLHPVLLTLAEELIDRTPGRPASREQVMEDWGTLLTDIDALREGFARLAPDALSEGQLTRAHEWCRERLHDLFNWIEGHRDGVEAPGLDEEDDALLLRLYQLRIGPLPGRKKRPLRYAHLVVDEVQDFSPLEIRVLLGCCGKRPSVTLSGDTQQHLIEGGGFTSWESFFGDLGVSSTGVNTLNISYRCTAQITRFARHVLGDLAEDEVPPSTVREGPDVELFRFDDHGAAVAHLAENLRVLLAAEPTASIILLTRNAALSGLYHRGLERADVEPLHRVRDQDFQFAPGVQITEVSQVKGLEFDYGILIEVSSEQYPDNATSRRLLHVAATRAAHQLWLTCVGSPSPLLPGTGDV